MLGFFFTYYGMQAVLIFLCENIHWSRYYWMVYIGPSFLAVVWFGSPPHPLPPPLPSASCLSFSVFLCVAYRAYWRERSGKGVIRRRESLILYKSFITLCIAHTTEKLLGQPLINFFSDIVRKNGEASANSFRFRVRIFLTFFFAAFFAILFNSVTLYIGDCYFGMLYSF